MPAVLPFSQAQTLPFSRLRARFCVESGVEIVQQLFKLAPFAFVKLGRAVMHISGKQKLYVIKLARRIKNYWYS